MGQNNEEGVKDYKGRTDRRRQKEKDGMKKGRKTERKGRREKETDGGKTGERTDGE